LLFQRYIYNKENNNIDNCIGLIKRLLSTCLLASLLCNYYFHKTISFLPKVGYDSGTTAIVALVKGDMLTVANVGDSRCVVCRNGIALEMSVDHKPEDSKELNRIQKAGGKVTGEGRVNGGLNLSRALGRVSGNVHG